MDQPLTSVKSSSGSIHFELKAGAGTWVFEERSMIRTLRGDLTAGEATGTFELIHIATVDAGTYRKYFGTYELDSIRFLYIRTWDELGENTLTYFDSTGRWRTVAIIIHGILLRAIHPPAHTRGKGSPFWRESGTPGCGGKNTGRNGSPAASNPSLRKMSVFRMDPSPWAQAWSRRSPPGQHPAVVLVHGSSSVTRDFFGPIAYVLAQKGIAVVSYDKRGVGASTGHWMDGGFQISREMPSQRCSS